jgi:adenylosuccinate synthase
LLEDDNLLNVDWERHGIDVETLVVENAQGLLLDKKYAPVDENGRTDVHTTPSRCGVEGTLEALGNSDSLSSITANYISRTYLTRHGAGPFPEQNDSLMFKDETNIPNGYQGSLRFGSFDDEAYDKLKQRIEADVNDGMKICRCHINKKLVATHMNEIEDVKFKENTDFLSYEDDSRMIKENRR